MVGGRCTDAGKRFLTLTLYARWATLASGSCRVHDAAISCRADVGEWPLQYARSIYWPDKLARAEALGAARDLLSWKRPVRLRAALTRCAGIHRIPCARPRPFEMRPPQSIRPKRALGIMFRSCALVMGMPRPVRGAFPARFRIHCCQNETGSKKQSEFGGPTPNPLLAECVVLYALRNALSR